MRMKTIIILLLFLLFSYSQDTPSLEETLAAQYGVIESTTFCVAPDGWFGYTLPAMTLILVTLIIILVYYVGVFLQSPNTISFAKKEFHEIALMVIFIGLLGLLQSSIETFVYSINEAIDYSFAILSRASTLFSILVSIYSFLYLVSSIVVQLPPPGTGPIGLTFSFSLSYLIRPLMDVMGIMTNMIVGVTIEWVVHLFTLCFIKRWAVSFLLPLGIVMRIIPPLRGGGNAILAFAIGLLIIYPAMFIMNREMITLFYTFEKINGIPTITSFTNEVLNGVAETFGLSHIFGDVFGSVLIILFAMLLFMSKALSVGVISIVLFFFVAWFVEFVFLLVIVSLLLPILNIFITLTFAREVARFLGSDINISAFMRLL